MKDTRGRIHVPCPNCEKALTFSGKRLQRYGDFQIGCPHCKLIVSARKAVSRHARLTRTEDDMDTIR